MSKTKRANPKTTLLVTAMHGRLFQEKPVSAMIQTKETNRGKKSNPRFQSVICMKN